MKCLLISILLKTLVESILNSLCIPYEIKKKRSKDVFFFDLSISPNQLENFAVDNAINLTEAAQGYYASGYKCAKKKGESLTEKILNVKDESNSQNHASFSQIAIQFFFAGNLDRIN